jgi:hypothetical protein
METLLRRPTTFESQGYFGLDTEMPLEVHLITSDCPTCEVGSLTTSYHSQNLATLNPDLASRL